MTIAEIRGKISETGSNLSERMEDLLTSDTFGCMRYLPPETVLIPFLNKAISQLSIKADSKQLQNIKMQVVKWKITNTEEDWIKVTDAVYMASKT